MADFDAEKAFLRSMQGDTGATSASATPQPPNTSHPSNDQHASKQPRTLGGFIVDDEEEEDENENEEEDISEDKPKVVAREDSSSGLLNVDRGTSNTPQQTHDHSPSNTLSPRHDQSIHSPAQEKEHDFALPNGSAHSVPNLAAVLPNTGASEEDSAIAKPSQTLPVPLQDPSATVSEAAQTALPKARLPNDRVGMLEDRIRDDPRGDMDAWLSLINEHKKRNKLEDARNTYERFFKVFPSAAEEWVAYANMELENNDFYRVEQIFEKSLLAIPNVQLWSTYLNYVRRRNNLTTDFTGNARQVVTQAYDFVLQNVGIDKDSGHLWQDYIQFLRSGPGQIGGSSWQDQQKMDLLRKAYQRAICIPMQQVNVMWKDYDAFEMGLNKTTGRKFLLERSPAYMTARSSYTALQNLTRDLERTTLPRLPPALGFEGDVEYSRQVDIWRKWIEWEKDDPLVLKEEDVAAFRARVLYVYKQATMALRFWPEIWFEASDFCFDNDLETEGNELLRQGCDANPESCLLAFKRADRLESTTTNNEDEDGMKRRGETVREPYDKVLDALYNLIKQVKQREVQTIARIKENFANQRATSQAESHNADDDDNEEPSPDLEAAQKMQIDAVQKGNASQIELLSKTVSHVWIALMRAMRRIQGKGSPNEAAGGGMRSVFTDARKRGRLTSDVYVASALMEYHCYKDPVATKIFERGMKLFPEDEHFAVEYLKHLIAINDTTNAVSVFETMVGKLAAKPETLSKAKPIYTFFHQYQARYGELSQVKKLEKRIKDLFPEDPRLHIFSQRYAVSEFDPTAVRLIISHAAQAKPKNMDSMEKPTSAQNSPRPPPAAPTIQVTNSPKRQLEESDTESVQAPRKIPRSESPLKGAAGRRLDAQKRTQLRNEINQSGGQSATPMQAPPPLPRDVHFLLSIIPRAETYNASYFNPESMVQLLRGIDLARAQAGRQQQNSTPQPQPPYGYGQQNPGYGYGR